MVSKDLQDFMCIPQVTQTAPIKHYLDDVLMAIMIFTLLYKTCFLIARE